MTPTRPCRACAPTSTAAPHAARTTRACSHTSGAPTGDPRPERNVQPRLLVQAAVFACAASAGAHAGLVPEHLRESPQLGVAFIASVVLLTAAGAALAMRPDSAAVARLAAALLTGLIAAYAASRTTGLPLLEPEPEPLDAVGLVTKLVELAGLVCALRLAQTPGGRRSPATQEVSR